MQNCINCKALCEQAGTLNQAVCKKFEKCATYVVETDDVLSFPNIIEVKSKKSNKKKLYMQIS